MASDSFSVELEEMVNDKIWKDTDGTGKTFYVCSVCSYHQKLRKDVAKHIERKHMNLSLPCPYCAATLASRIELRTHVKTKHENQPFR